MPHRPAPTLHPILAALLAGGLLTLGACGQRTDDAGRADDAAQADEIAASHILVAWTGVRDCPADLQRTRQDAEERARRLAFLLRTGRGELSDLARRYSDDPTAQRNGGYLGVFRPGEMQEPLAGLVASLAEGEIGGPVATPFGWHVVRREPVRKVRLHHVLVAHRDALGADPRVERDQAEAARIAEALRVKLSRPGVDHCAVAATFSDDPENRHVCGDLGWIEPGLLEPEVEEAIFALQPGEVSAVVETIYGYHIFWRP